MTLLEKLRFGVGCVITSAWLASIILAAVDRTYSPPYTLHLTMMIVAGWLFAPSIVKRRGS